MEIQKHALSIYTKKREFRKEEGLLYNRLCSIVEDSEFITYISGLFPGYPLVANLRCGLWYSPKFDGTCYFKSTDGHTHHWTFSKTRLNLHIALLAATHGGCLIVDSTRKGKKFPDSFSRTIPIWCATVNRAIAVLRNNDTTTTPITTTPNQDNNETSASSDLKTATINSTSDIATNEEHPNTSTTTSNTTTITATSDEATNDEIMDEDDQDGIWDEDLHVPLWVSKTERLQMERLVDSFVKSLLESGADLSSLVASLRKPLRPIWVCPSSLLIENMMPDRSKLPFASVICVSASRVQDVIYFADLQTSAYRYVQGAGDDEEGWARGLRPETFWKDTNLILDDGPSGIEDRVSSVLKEIENALGQCITLRNEPSSTNAPYVLIGRTGLAVSTAIECPNWYEIFDTSPKPAFVNCSPLPYRLQGSQSLLTDTPYYKHVPVSHKKAGKVALGQALRAVVPFVCSWISGEVKEEAKGEIKGGGGGHEEPPRRLVIIHSYESSEIPVCICLVVLAKLFDVEGEHVIERSAVSKEDMGKLYLLVDKYLPLSLPSRTLRNVVNDFLMGPPPDMRDPPPARRPSKNKKQVQQNEEDLDESTLL